ncbi:MAG: hypothetical protein ACRED3_15960, partial [Bradyrhizobium sp.]
MVFLLGATMKTRIAAAFFLCALLSACTASPPAASRSDWIKAADGNYTHRPSGAVCAVEVEGFALQGLLMPAIQGSLGTCEYIDGAGRIGEIRVRRYIAGVGETPGTIQNDDALMRGTVSDAPNKVLQGTVRVGIGPEIDGEPSVRFMVTVVRNGLLIDCVVWERQTLWASS